MDANATVFRGKCAWATSIRPRKCSRSSRPMTGRGRSTCSIWSGLRAQAAYPDGRKATGAEAYAAYGRESGPVFERLGGRIVWQGRFELMLIGPADGALGSLLHRRISKRRGVRRDDPRSRLPRSGEAPPGRGRGFPPDPARGAAGRQDVWRDSEVTLDSVMGGQGASVPTIQAKLASSRDGGHAALLPTLRRPKKIGGPEGPPIASSADRFDGSSRLARRAGVLEDRAEQFPALAVEPHHLQLLVDAIVVRRGVGDDARQRQIEPTFFRLVACFMTFSRVRLSPHFWST